MPKITVNAMEHPSLSVPEVYIWKKRPYGKARGGRIIELHDGSDAWMFWSTYWRENDTRAKGGDLFHVITRINKAGTLNVANIVRCCAAGIEAEQIEKSFEELAIEPEHAGSNKTEL